MSNADGAQPKRTGGADAPHQVEDQTNTIDARLHLHAQLAWQKGIDALNRLTDSQKEGEMPTRALYARIAEETRRMRDEWDHASRNLPAPSPEPPRPAVEQKVEEILRILKNDGLGARRASPAAPTYAAIAAQAENQVLAAVAPHRPQAIRVRYNNKPTGSPTELLQEVRRDIAPGAVAVRTLRSGDVDVFVTNQAAKDQVQNGPNGPGYQILRKDYLVEVPGVPLTLQVAHGRNADNSQLIHSICEATKKIATGTQITRLRWLHQEKKDTDRSRNAAEPRVARTRGTLIVGFPTQAQQHKAIHKGLIIESQLFATRLFDNSLIATQCFNCNQWGHTQSACGKKTRCARCAGEHDTRKCDTGRVSCCNCGKTDHKAWQKGKCRAYGAYHAEIQAKRMALIRETTRARSAGNSPTTSTLSVSDYGWTTTTSSSYASSDNSRKRVRSDQGEESQGVGRPSFVTVAGRDPTQGRIPFAATPNTNFFPSSTAPPTFRAATAEPTSQGAAIPQRPSGARVGETVNTAMEIDTDASNNKTLC
jgi:hypothetical protein